MFRRFARNHAALKALAAVLTAQVRRGDLAARTGGEEFAVVLPDCPVSYALRRAEDLRAVIAAESITWPNPVTVSIGVAAVPDHGDTAAQLVTAADAALYAAKGGGRTMVTAAHS